MTECELMELVANRVNEVISICRECFTIEYLEEKMGVSKPTIYAYCSGTRPPSALFIHNLSMFTGVSADYLLGMTDVQWKP